MEFHERKNLNTDRVTLVPGPTEEVETVRKIFRMVLEGHTLKQIASHLNEQKRTTVWLPKELYQLLDFEHI